MSAVPETEAMKSESETTAKREIAAVEGRIGNAQMWSAQMLTKPHMRMRQ